MDRVKLAEAVEILRKLKPKKILIIMYKNVSKNYYINFLTDVKAYQLEIIDTDDIYDILYRISDIGYVAHFEHETEKSHLIYLKRPIASLVDYMG